jgi:hypothetical protein
MAQFANLPVPGTVQSYHAHNVAAALLRRSQDNQLVRAQAFTYDMFSACEAAHENAAINHVSLSR